MIALCQEHRLEHRTKHIALRYFLARELQQRGQLRLAYVATRTNTADVFTKALPSGDHQRFVTVLGLLALLFLTGLVITSPVGRGLQAKGRPPHQGLISKTSHRGRRPDYSSLQADTCGNLKKPPAELILKWIDEAWADVPEEMVRKAFLTCGISNAEDGSQDHLILVHMRDSGEVEVLEDVMEEDQDELVPQPVLPGPRGHPSRCDRRDGGGGRACR
ncbi:unnamed protein product [Closterium sp. NIES-53]